MDPTRRLWATAGLAVGLAGLAVVLARPLALVGTAFVGVWLLSRQYLFYRATSTLVGNLTVTQTPARNWVHTDETVPVTLTANLDDSSALSCSLRAGVPIAATADGSLSLSLDPDTTTATATVDVRWPVAGEHAFEQATLSVTDGLFEQTLPVGSTPSVTVEPRSPRNVHVGEGGERLAAAYGEHDAGRQGSGIEPAELREYMPGDTVNQIDWNATARLGTPHVREFDAETDRKTLLVMDHRSALGMGPPDETKLAYLREVALAVVDSARQLGDPLGLLLVGDGGITAQLTPATTQEVYVTARQKLLTATPTGQTTDDSQATDNTSSLAMRRGAQTVGDVQRAYATLEAGDGPFEETVRPFYADRQRYRKRIESEPLYGAVQQALAPERGPVFAVLCTDDSAPAELRETVQLARREGGRVLVLLAPTVLYEQGGLGDVERAYDRYLEFEELRRELGRMEGVTALEVGPGDRLASVLSAGQNSRQRLGGVRR